MGQTGRGPRLQAKPAAACGHGSRVLGELAPPEVKGEIVRVSCQQRKEKNLPFKY